MAAPGYGRRGGFYADLFGWSSEPAGDPEQTGGYRQRGPGIQPGL